MVESELVEAAGAGDWEAVGALLEAGADPNEPDDFGQTPLVVAAEVGATRCVRALLDAGADPNLARTFRFSPALAAGDPALAKLLAEHGTDLGESPMKTAATLEIARMLAAAGGDLAEINVEVRDELIGRVRTASIECSAEDYQAARHRVFGDANPQPMNLPFWRAMVAAGKPAYEARAQFGESPSNGGAVWCDSRFGQSFTELPDGRVIEIGGEHEDYYDEDFCIYNDVIVHQGGGRFDIYGYPREVFPPTDFHSATLVGDHIHIIGGLGYMGERRFGLTPVYRLNVHTLAIEPVETQGAAPGWISRHRARLVGDAIEVSGGKVSALKRKFWGLGRPEETYDDNQAVHRLELGSMTWSRVS